MPLISLDKIQCAMCGVIRDLPELIDQPASNIKGVPACECGALEFLIETEDNGSEHAGMVNELFAALRQRPVVTFLITNPNPINTEIIIPLHLNKEFPCQVPILVNRMEQGLVDIDDSGYGELLIESPEPAIVILSAGNGYQCTPCEVIFNE